MGQILFLPQRKIDNSNGGKISKWQMATNAIVSGVVSGVTAGLIGGPGAKAPITRTGIKMVNQQFGMGTVKSFITQPIQRVISKNFAMGVVKTAIIAPINAAISSNVITVCRVSSLVWHSRIEFMGSSWRARKKNLASLDCNYTCQRDSIRNVFGSLRFLLM